ncbi:MAG: hypothetical protein ACREAN_07990 [Nitrosopumilaceae archaeon]
MFVGVCVVDEGEDDEMEVEETMFCEKDDVIEAIDSVDDVLVDEEGVEEDDVEDICELVVVIVEEVLESVVDVVIEEVVED